MENVKTEKRVRDGMTWRWRRKRLRRRGYSSGRTFALTQCACQRLCACSLRVADSHRASAAGRNH